MYSISAIFTKGNNIWDGLFDSLSEKSPAEKEFALKTQKLIVEDKSFW